MDGKQIAAFSFFGLLFIGLFLFGCVSSAESDVETGPGDRPWCPKEITHSQMSGGRDGQSGTTGNVMEIDGIEYCQEIYMSGQPGAPESERWFSQNGSYERNIFKPPVIGLQLFCNNYENAVTSYGGTYNEYELIQTKDGNCLTRKGNESFNVCPVDCDLNFTGLENASDCTSLPVLCVEQYYEISGCNTPYAVLPYQEACHAFFDNKRAK